MSFSNSSNKLLQSLQSNITVEILLKGKNIHIQLFQLDDPQEQAELQYLQTPS
jgi:hypothetical protein